MMDEKPVTLGMSRLNPRNASEKQESQREPAPKPTLPINLSADDIETLRDRIIDMLRTVYDPEIPVNIYELGLIYDIYIKPNGFVNIRMTLTTPACPVAGSLPGEVEHRIQPLEGVSKVQVDLVWDPPWDKSRMSEAAKLQLGIDD